MIFNVVCSHYLGCTSRLGPVAENVLVIERSACCMAKGLLTQPGRSAGHSLPSDRAGSSVEIGIRQPKWIGQFTFDLTQFRRCHLRDPLTQRDGSPVSCDVPSGSPVFYAETAGTELGKQMR